MISKEEVISKFALFFDNNGGITSWIGPATPDIVFERLSKINEDPLSKVQLDQLLVLSHEAGVSDGFFAYYWLSAPTHTYDVTMIPDFNPEWLAIGKEVIVSLEHLKWGLYRLYIDSLLYFGSIRSGYRFLRDLNSEDLQEFFQSKRFNTELIKKRGPALSLKNISKDDRYLISEMACKSYGAKPQTTSDLKKILIEAWKKYSATGGRGRIKIGSLLDESYLTGHKARLFEFKFSSDDILEEEITSEEDIEKKYENIAEKFIKAREAALQNTSYYLSMVNDLDIYVATSMRSRNDFRIMANTCEKIFLDSKLKDLQLRYFDPTLSAAEGHEDKGLIECLMVKSAKALLYSAGEKESYGKDAEAAMALSLGKPVIFYCDEEQRRNFYRDVHPLSRLIHFDSGVAVGAMVTDKVDDVIELINRIVENKMEYVLEQPKTGYFKLKERLTGSIIRLQTNNTLLRETFWNYYHKK